MLCFTATGSDRCVVQFVGKVSHVLVVAVYVRHSPVVLCVEAHPLHLHFHSLAHMITCTHSMEGESYFTHLGGITLHYWLLCVRVWTWATEMDVLVLIIGAASQTPGVVGQGEQILQSRWVSDGSVQTLHPLLALLERCKVASVVKPSAKIREISEMQQNNIYL